MATRRLVGIDLGIASAHTVRVLDETGATVTKRKAWPTVESLTEIEQAALASAEAGTVLEVVMEPTGPAWLPIAVFFTTRGHRVYRVSSAKAADLRRFLSRHTKTNGIDAETLARLPLFDPVGLRPLELPGAQQAALDRRVRATDRLTRAGAEHKRRIKDLVRQVLPMSPLSGDLGVADLVVLERYADPRAAGPGQGRGQPADRADHQGLPRPSGPGSGGAVAGGGPGLPGALRRSPRGGVRRPGRGDRHRGAAAARDPS